MTAQDLAGLGDALAADRAGALVERPLQTAGARGEQRASCAAGFGVAFDSVRFGRSSCIVVSLTTAVSPSGETTTPAADLLPHRAPDLANPQPYHGAVPVYLDHAASTPMRPDAIAAMLPFLAESPGNPSGAHGASRVTKTALEAAREIVADALGADPAEIVFTGSGSEADNLAVKGAAWAGADAQRRSTASSPPASSTRRCSARRPGSSARASASRRVGARRRRRASISTRSPPRSTSAPRSSR